MRNNFTPFNNINNNYYNKYSIKDNIDDNNYKKKLTTPKLIINNYYHNKYLSKFGYLNSDNINNKNINYKYNNINKYNNNYNNNYNIYNNNYNNYNNNNYNNNNKIPNEYSSNSYYKNYYSNLNNNYINNVYNKNLSFIPEKHKLENIANSIVYNIKTPPKIIYPNYNYDFSYDHIQYPNGNIEKLDPFIEQENRQKDYFFLKSTKENEYSNLNYIDYLKGKIDDYKINPFNSIDNFKDNFYLGESKLKNNTITKPQYNYTDNKYIFNNNNNYNNNNYNNYYYFNNKYINNLKIK